MRYFILKNPDNYSATPDIINWYSVIDVRNICKEKAHLLQRRELLPVRSNPDLVWTDVICKPFLLVSGTVRGLLLKYEPVLNFRQIVLLDEKNELAQTYYLPILERIDCLHDTSELSIDRSVIKKPVIQLSKVGDASVFWIAGVKNTYTVVRLDFAESLLRRETRGIGLLPVECV